MAAAAKKKTEHYRSVECPHCHNSIGLMKSSDILEQFGLLERHRARTTALDWPDPWIKLTNVSLWLENDVVDAATRLQEINLNRRLAPLLEEMPTMSKEDMNYMLEQLQKTMRTLVDEPVKPALNRRRRTKG